MDTKKLSYALTGSLIIFVLALSGCAGRQAPVKMTDSPGKKSVAMTAGNFKFEPSVIQALKGDILVFEILNTSSRTHNFTIKDPKGKVLKSVDLPEKKTVAVEISLPEAGVYDFFCDKTFHTTMGMKGRVEVLTAR